MYEHCWLRTNMRLRTAGTACRPTCLLVHCLCCLLLVLLLLVLLLLPVIRYPVLLCCFFCFFAVARYAVLFLLLFLFLLLLFLFLFLFLFLLSCLLLLGAHPSVGRCAVLIVAVACWTRRSRELASSGLDGARSCAANSHTALTARHAPIKRPPCPGRRTCSVLVGSKRGFQPCKTVLPPVERTEDRDAPFPLSDMPDLGTKDSEPSSRQAEEARETARDTRISSPFSAVELVCSFSTRGDC